MKLARTVIGSETLSPPELARFGNRASAEPAARAAERLISATVSPMKIPEVIAQEIADLVKPLAVDGAVAVYHLVRALVTHPDGAELQARRALQGLEAQAEIRA
jgi:hypothetical protein